jgi:hypothetical protein
LLFCAFFLLRSNALVQGIPQHQKWPRPFGAVVGGHIGESGCSVFFALSLFFCFPAMHSVHTATDRLARV